MFSQIKDSSVAQIMPQDLGVLGGKKNFSMEILRWRPIDCAFKFMFTSMHVIVDDINFITATECVQSKSCAISAHELPC